MKILKTDADSLKKAVFLLKKGEIVIYPTDTAYALGCDAMNKKAVKKIYKIKNRPAGKPLPVIVSSLALAKNFFKFSKKEFQLAKTYWPGALSLVLQIKCPKHPPPHPSPLTRGRAREGVAVRVSDNRIARSLSSKLSKPIISTSANISGMGECYSVKDVLKQFENKKHQPDFILDAGRLKRRKPSTIVKVADEGIEVIRKGPIIIE